MCPVWVHRFAVLTAGATLVLIFVGALVTSTGSGLAVPDWPLSFGQVFPPMVGGVLFEHEHRLVAALVGLLTVALMVLLTQWESRIWVRWLARGAVLAVLLQGTLGGMTVLLRLPLVVSVTHACLCRLTDQMARLPDNLATVFLAPSTYGVPHNLARHPQQRSPRVMAMLYPVFSEYCQYI